MEKEPRRLVDMICSNFVEMHDHGKLNWCCGAGGGVGAIEEAHELKMMAFNAKKRQLEEVKPDKLITACANCRIQLEEGLEENNMDIPVVGLTEMLAEHLADKTDA